MKLEALDHPKTMELAAQLGVELPTAIGYLELLWAFVGKKTPRGDVGKWSDAVIASACLWRGKPADFVQALITSGYVDADDEYRLLVHDWPQHCPNWVRAKLKKDGVEFALKSALKSALKTSSNADSNAGTSRADLNQAKPSEEKPSEGKGSASPPAHFDGWKFIEDRMQPNFPEGDYPQTAWINASRTVERIVETDGLAVLDAIEAGCKRFLAQAVARGEVGGPFIVNPDRFLTERRWTGKFSIPMPKQRGGSAADRVTWRPDA